MADKRELQTVFAVVSTDADGEAICFYQSPDDGSMIPLIGSGDDLEQLASLRKVAESYAQTSGKFTKLLKFSNREMVAEFSPVITPSHRR